MVNTSASIPAGMVFAVVNIGLAVLPSISLWAFAGVGIEVRSALASVLTGVALALVLLGLAPFSFIARFALTDVLIEPILTSSTIEARI